jgi:hypothetical protein
MKHITINIYQVISSVYNVLMYKEAKYCQNVVPLCTNGSSTPFGTPVFFQVTMSSLCLARLDKNWAYSKVLYMLTLLITQGDEESRKKWWREEKMVKRGAKEEYNSKVYDTVPSSPVHTLFILLFFNFILHSSKIPQLFLLYTKAD